MLNFLSHGVKQAAQRRRAIDDQLNAETAAMFPGKFDTREVTGSTWNGRPIIANPLFSLDDVADSFVDFHKTFHYASLPIHELPIKPKRRIRNNKPKVEIPKNEPRFAEIEYLALSPKVHYADLSCGCTHISCGITTRIIPCKQHTPIEIKREQKKALVTKQRDEWKSHFGPLTEIEEYESC